MAEQIPHNPYYKKDIPGDKPKKPKKPKKPSVFKRAKRAISRSARRTGKRVGRFFGRIGAKVRGFFRVVIINGKRRIIVNRNLVMASILLLAITGITTCVVGFIIGQRTEPQLGGDSTDNIILTPGEDRRISFSLSGTVTYTDGTPVPDAQVQLHSEPMNTLTDADGRFFFHRVASGEHTVSVLNKAGKVLASSPIKLDANTNYVAVDIEWSEETGYLVKIPVDVILVEMNLEIGRGVDSENEHLPVEDPIGVCPGGTVLDEDGSKRPTPSTPVTTPADNRVLRDGTVVLPDNSVLLSDGTLVRPNSTVTYSDGVQETVIGEKTLENGAKLNADENTLTTPGGYQVDLETGEITPPAGMVEDDTVKVFSENRAWDQSTVIDLFSGIEKLEPGSKGIYTFRVSNTHSTPVIFSLTVTDDHTNPIPFDIKLKDANGKAVSAEAVTLGSESSMVYTIHWSWPYEGGDDAGDTAIGGNDELKHTVTVTIHAESAA